MLTNLNTELSKKGFAVVEKVFSEEEIQEIITLISIDQSANTFGEREFLYNYPEVSKKVFTNRLIQLVKSIAPNCTKSIKSIYFDKPPSANWIVNWHQDLTINVTQKQEIEGFQNWRVMKDRVVVQPNLSLLHSIFTLRIHLDDCTKKNGALRVIEGSHQQGVIPIKDWLLTKTGKEHCIEAKKGDVLIMKPLILHASKRTENNVNRRVIHVEFTDQDAPEGLKWKEAICF